MNKIKFILSTVLAFSISLLLFRYSSFGIDFFVKSPPPIPFWILRLFETSSIFIVAWFVFNRTIPFIVKSWNTPCKYWSLYQGNVIGFYIAIIYFVFFYYMCLEVVLTLLIALLALFFSIIGNSKKDSIIVGSDDSQLSLSDNPIEYEDEDLLGMSKAVDEIISAVTSTWEKRGVVVAVYGQNGTGKSSCINLSKNRLAEERPDIHIQTFEPYRYADEKEMVRNFFEAAIMPLDKKYSLPGANSFSKKLTKIAYGVSTNVPLINLEIGNLIDFLTPSIDFNSIQKMLDNYLDELNEKILIIVDDIDRCSIRKRHLFFQMVVAMEPFKNVRILISASVNEIFQNYNPHLISNLD